MNIVDGYNMDLLAAAFVDAQHNHCDVEEFVKSGGDLYVSLHPNNRHSHQAVCSYLVRGNPLSKVDPQYILVRLDANDNITDSRLVSAQGEQVWAQLSQQLIKWHAHDFGTGPF